MKHGLKILPQYFCRVQDGSKTFEVRENDRGFQPGDIVVLNEWNPATRSIDDPLGSYEMIIGFTGNFMTFKVGYVYPLPDGKHVVFSLLENKPAKTTLKENE